MWAAAGNMWIAANQPGKAALALDKALAGTGLQAEQRGEALLDRARAAEAQNDLKTARSKVTEAARTVSDDPFLWYFSAALAIRENDAVTAKAAIGKALTLEPNNPTILFEAGHVHHFAGDEASARTYWSRASAADPNGKSGQAAREALKLLPTPAPTKAELAKVVVDRRDDPDLLIRRTAARRSAFVAGFAVARADREIALAGGLDPADLGAAVASELLGASAGALVGFGDHLGLQVVELGEDVADVRPADRDAVADEFRLTGVGVADLHHVCGCAAGSSG